MHKLAINDAKVIQESLQNGSSFYKILQKQEQAKDNFFFLAKQLQEYEQVSLLASEFLNEKHNPEFFKVLTPEKVSTKQIRLVSQLVANSKSHMCKPVSLNAKKSQI